MTSLDGAAVRASWYESFVLSVGAPLVRSSFIRPSPCARSFVLDCVRERRRVTPAKEAGCATAREGPPVRKRDLAAWLRSGANKWACVGRLVCEAVLLYRSAATSICARQLAAQGADVDPELRQGARSCRRRVAARASEREVIKSSSRSSLFAAARRAAPRSRGAPFRRVVAAAPKGVRPRGTRNRLEGPRGAQHRAPAF